MTVSVAMITYNHEKYIREAIEGVLMQKTNFQFELVIGEDYSNDNTRRICEEYAKAYPDKINLLQSEKNHGMIPNFIRTLESCHGKYIALCEGDDYWTDPYKLQKQVDFLEANKNFIGCYHRARIIRENNNKEEYLPSINEESDLNFDTLIGKNKTATASVVFRNILSRDDLNKLETLYPGDWGLYFTLSKYGKIKYLDFVGSVYRINDGGAWTSLNQLDNLNYKLRFFNNLKKIFSDDFHGKIDDKIKSINDLINKLDKSHLNNSLTNYEKQVNDEFINPCLTYDNIDKYYVRISIKKTIEDNLINFGGVLLDLGCGEMPYKQYILSNSKVEKYIGLDIENPTYQKNTKPDLFWDGNQIPLESNSVDCVLATEFFEHVPYPEKILTEVQRVLRPGGFLLLTVPFIWPLHTMPYDEYRYTPFSLERILRNSNFNDINIKALGGWNASFAQVMGLWIRRSPMPKEVRNSYTEAFFPFYKKLIESDEIPDNFNSSMLITGLTAVAKKKINNNDQANDFSNSAINNVECPVCGKTFEKFKPYGANNSPNRCCPECGAVERHRLLWLYLTRKRNILSENLNLLDIAPTKGIGNKLKSMPNINYLSIDLTSSLAMKHMDITALDLPDNFYDCVLCYHVFEHIPDDRKAMREVLRVLKPGGWAILQVPINKKLEKTHEGTHIQDPAERRRLFGQEDHVRYYGLDYKDRLSEEGFIVYVDEFAKNLPDEEVKKYRLIKDEEIYFCTKPSIKNISNKTDGK